VVEHGHGRKIRLKGKLNAGHKWVGDKVAKEGSNQPLLGYPLTDVARKTARVFTAAREERKKPTHKRNRYSVQTREETLIKEGREKSRVRCIKRGKRNLMKDPFLRGDWLLKTGGNSWERRVRGTSMTGGRCWGKKIF